MFDWWSPNALYTFFPFQNQSSRSQRKTRGRLCTTTKKSHCAPPHFIVNSLIKTTCASTFPEQRQRHSAWEEASTCILPRTPRLRCSSQLRPTCIVLHLHNHRESSLLFAQDFSKSFWSLSVSFPRWVGGLFVQRTLSCVYQRWRPLLRKCLF